MRTIRHVIGLSGGKDSTAMAVRLHELNPDVPYELICTPTGDELPEMQAHWAALECRLGKPIHRLTLTKAGADVGLNDLIEEMEALPNFRMRWCTRMLKIQPTIDWIKQQQVQGDIVHLYVGLRADEEERKGIYSESVTSVFPMREWGWGVREVWAYLAKNGIKIPRRTDCARCYAQRIGEWYALWKHYPAIYASAVEQEAKVGHTFRKPGGKWPAPLVALAAEFERGNIPRTVKEAQQALFPELAEDDGACRVCRLRRVPYVALDYQPKDDAQIAPYRHLLGKVSDRQIASQAGLHRNTVRWMRQRAGIAAMARAG
jgi:3'-phosphoadenosine 5'-phosphosulfate sulfotransferase (PAPS reductase)/FAD synthetase